MKQAGFTKLLLALPTLALLHGCGTAFESFMTEGTILYTHGARQDTAMLQIDLPPDRVYQSLLDVVAKRPKLKLVNQNAERYLIEAERDDGAMLSVQATPLSSNQTLLFLWADARATTKVTGEDLARYASEEICRELAVKCVIKEN